MRVHLAWVRDLHVFVCCLQIALIMVCFDVLDPSYITTVLARVYSIIGRMTILAHRWNNSGDHTVSHSALSRTQARSIKAYNPLDTGGIKECMHYSWDKASAREWGPLEANQTSAITASPQKARCELSINLMRFSICNPPAYCVVATFSPWFNCLIIA